MPSASVWRYSRQKGAGPAIGFIGSGPVALLAGFDLVAVLSVSQRPIANQWNQVALLLLTLGVATLIVTILFVVSAQMYWASPDQRLVWKPEATVNPDELKNVRRQQFVDYHLLLKYNTRVSIGLTLGLSATVAGLAASLLAEKLNLFSYMAAALLGVTLIIVILWATEKFTLLFPGIGQIKESGPAPLSDDGMKAMFKDQDDAARSSGGDGGAANAGPH
jgi:branched-subunit amino acid ABC-type transport system permease component